jgi:hypothetical protein
MAYIHPVTHTIALKTADQVRLLARMWRTSSYSETIERVILNDHRMGLDTADVRTTLAASRVDKRDVKIKDVKLASEVYREWQRLHVLYGYRWHGQTMEHMVVRAFHNAGFEPDNAWEDLGALYDRSRVARAKREYRSAPERLNV